MAVTYDVFPRETSFQLSRQEEGGGTTEIAVVPQPAGYPRLETVTVTETLTNGYYAFEIFDAWGDGICCTFGNGEYALSADGIVLTRGKEFRFTEFVCLEVRNGTVTVLGTRDRQIDCRSIS